MSDFDKLREIIVGDIIKEVELEITDRILIPVGDSLFIGDYGPVEDGLNSDMYLFPLVGNLDCSAIDVNFDTGHYFFSSKSIEFKTFADPVLTGITITGSHSVIDPEKVINELNRAGRIFLDVGQTGWIQSDFGSVKTGLLVMRGDRNGKPGDLLMEISEDGTTWNTLHYESDCTDKNLHNELMVVFPNKTLRYARWVSGITPKYTYFRANACLYQKNCVNYSWGSDNWEFKKMPPCTGKGEYILIYIKGSEPNSSFYWYWGIIAKSKVLL
ncbi:MAG: hypothetical protein KAX49_03820 [Halanaerobiales bacterium]|nr:hypothetical protein [Halanaerobiales bacterium]